MRHMVLKSSLVLAVALAAPLSFARDEAPDALLNGVTVEVMSILNHDGDLQAGSAAKVSDLVEIRILPLFDFPRMTQTALARNWRLASAEQQAMLIAEFRTLLVRTYSVTLSNSRDRPIEFKRTRMSPGDTEVRVKSEVKQPGRERMAIDYDMEKTPAGWKVYDIKVGGVSLITRYRETFAHVVREEGVDGLIKALAGKNRAASLGIKPVRTTFREQSRIMFVMLHSALQGRR
jgi:phospholipid transport system substrate-binding protein